MTNQFDFLLLKYGNWIKIGDIPLFMRPTNHRDYDFELMFPVDKKAYYDIYVDALKTGYLSEENMKDSNLAAKYSVYCHQHFARKDDLVKAIELLTSDYYYHHRDEDNQKKFEQLLKDKYPKPVGEVTTVKIGIGETEEPHTI